MSDRRLTFCPRLHFAVFRVWISADPQLLYTDVAQPKAMLLADAMTVRLDEVSLRESYKRSGCSSTRAYEIRYDRRQRWSERPQKMITALLLHAKTQKCFKRVVYRDVAVVHLRSKLASSKTSRVALFARLGTACQLSTQT